MKVTFKIAKIEAHVKVVNSWSPVVTDKLPAASPAVDDHEGDVTLDGVEYVVEMEANEFLGATKEMAAATVAMVKDMVSGAVDGYKAKMAAKASKPDTVPSA